MDTRPPKTGTKTSAPYYTPQVLRTLSQKCTLGEVSRGAITFKNALGPAKNMSGGYACTSVGCTLNGTVPYVYKKFGQEQYAFPEDRFLECAREVIMTTLAWQAAPQYVSPLRHFGIHREGTPEVAPFLMSFDHGVSLSEFLARPTVALNMTVKRELCLRLLRALTALHASGIYHGDLRSANVVLSPSKCENLVLIDFGLARRETRPGLPVDNFVRSRWTSPQPVAFQSKGNVYAPEYYRGGPTAATDMWSLAPLLVRILIRDARDALRGIEDTHWQTTVGDILRLRQRNPAVASRIWKLVLDCAAVKPLARMTSGSLSRVFENTRVTRVGSDEKLVSSGAA